MYKTLNDVAKAHPRLSLFATVGNIKVWYARHTRDSSMGYAWLKENGKLADFNNMEATHVLVGSFQMDEPNPDEVLRLMQGEVWSPNGEAFEMIDALGLTHTTIRDGDVIQIGNRYLLVDGGFRFVNLFSGRADR